MSDTALRVLAPRARLVGSGDGDSLQNVNTTTLPNGAFCWVNDQAALYYLDKGSIATPTPPSVIAPGSGPGRWFSLKEDDMLPLTVDAFGRLRVSNPQAIFDTKQIDFASSIYLVPNFVTLGGTATYSALRSSTALASAAVVGSRAVRQTRRKFNYQPGKGQLIDLTFCMNNPAAGASLRAGYYDDGDGIFFSLDNGPNPTWTLRSSTSGVPVDTVVPQASWNIDKLDGTGTSGLTLNPVAAQIAFVSFEWLGDGGVLVGFLIDRAYVPVHAFDFANNTSVVYMRTPDLPLRWEAITTDTSAGASMDATCGTVISEGGAEDLGVRRSHYHNTNVTVAIGETRELISIRLKGVSTADNAVAATFTTVFAEAFSAFTTSADAALAIIGYAPTFTGAGTWAAPAGGAFGSSVEVSTSGRVVTSPGMVMASQFFSAQLRSVADEFDRVLALGIDPATGTSDVISLMIANVSLGGTTVRGSFTWRELL